MVVERPRSEHLGLRDPQREKGFLGERGLLHVYLEEGLPAGVVDRRGCLRKVGQEPDLTSQRNEEVPPHLGVAEQDGGRGGGERRRGRAQVGHLPLEVAVRRVPELPLELLDARRPHLEQLAVLGHLALVLRLDLLHPTL